MLEAYVPILVLTAIAAGVAGFIVVANALLGPGSKNKTKLDPFECGSPPSGDPIEHGRRHFGVKFYLVAIVFLLFDIETVFLIPWAMLYKGFPQEWMGMTTRLSGSVGAMSKDISVFSSPDTGPGALFTGGVFPTQSELTCMI